MIQRRYLGLSAFLVLWSMLLPGIHAQAATPKLEIWAAADGVHVRWQSPPSLHDPANPSPEWPLVELNGWQLPAQLLAVQFPDQHLPAPQPIVFASTPAAGSLQRAPQRVPESAQGRQRPALIAAQSSALPTSPITAMRSGRLRGAAISVFAISPFYFQAGSLHLATNFAIVIPGAILLPADPLALMQPIRPFIHAAVGPADPARLDQVPGLRTAQSATATWEIVVAQPGMQRLTGADLAASGLDLSTLDPRHLHVRRQAQELALDLRLAQPGRLAPSDELRFYVAAVGDRWNATTSFWLTVEPTAGLRMAQRNGLPATAALRTIGREFGHWQANALYDSTLAGVDGDHWFAADLRTGPGLPPFTMTLPLTPSLALVGGTTIITVTGAAYTAGEHRLEARMAGAVQTVRWQGAGSWSQVFTLTANASPLTLTLRPGNVFDGVELDQVAWQRDVSLDLQGKAALWRGNPGRWRYQLRNLPATRTLYDVGDPRQPVIVSLPSGSDPQFEAAEVGPYLLSTAASLVRPSLLAYTAVDLTTPQVADAIYIVPATLRTALEPLLTWRRSTGQRVIAVDVRAIYAQWSDGQIAPEAIRAFLRFVAAEWPTVPQAVVLVGDGTSDPRNYTGRNNATLIPPYLAEVDPWLGETACDHCYAQLDGLDPLTSPDSDALADVLIGRLPVKNSEELSALAQKIITYEQAPLAPWQARMIAIADDADSGGDFAAFADLGWAAQPRGVDRLRMYYDPLATPTTPWREANPKRAYERTQAAFNMGAALLSYTGHSNEWQWAVTDPSATPSYLLSLYDPDSLQNGIRQPIVLEMTCLTSAFQRPAFSGTTIDERLVLKPNGGAIATWGSSGKGVVYGHDALQQGFYAAAWSKASRQPVGMLTQAGYLELFLRGGCCQETLRTFVLLGDPLTVTRLWAARRVYLPVLLQQ